MAKVLCRYFIGGVVKNNGRKWYVQHPVFSAKPPFWGLWEGAGTSKGKIILNVVHEGAEPAKNWRLVSPLETIQGDNFQDIHEETLSAAFADHYKSLIMKGVFGG